LGSLVDAAVRVERLVTDLVNAVGGCGLTAEPGAAVAYGQRLRVSSPDGALLGHLVAYWGEKGPCVAFNQLRADVPTETRQRLVAAAKAAVVSAQEEPPPAQPVRPAKPVEAPSPPRRRSVEIWVDGSFVRDKRRVAVGWAFMVREGGQEVHRASGTDVPPGTEKHWNVAGEVVSVLKALEWCRAEGVTHASIHHDYEGLSAWPTRRWKAKTELTKAYVREVAASGVQVKWHWVPSHSGSKHNESVDKLARDAALAALDGRQHPDL